MKSGPPPPELPRTAAELAAWVVDARARTLGLVADLDDDQLMGPRLPTVNPLLWEIGHVAWFQERWVLRHALGRKPLRADADALWDSIAIAHDTRWDLPLPPRRETLAYVEAVRDAVLEHLDRGDPPPEVAYHVVYSVFHEDMHGEAFVYTRQTLGYPAPAPGVLCAGSAEGRAAEETPAAAGPVGFQARPGLAPERDRTVHAAPADDVRVPGGPFRLGAEPREPFVFDNEKWAHPIEIAPFSISRTAVTEDAFAAFVADGGYRRRELWTPAGWRWREAEGARLPLYWREAGPGRFERRRFDRWEPLRPGRAMVHVNAFEAEAYCRWAGRRLPTEAEWEAAAASVADASGTRLAGTKRRFPWGDAPPPGARRARLDGRGGGPGPVDDLPGGDSAFGARQMLGNVWEWTATPFAPYPGFEPDPYREYSAPWFHTHRVLRGGCWATRARLVRNTWRNFYEPHRRDVWAGLRTCAPD